MEINLSTRRALDQHIIKASDRETLSQVSKGGWLAIQLSKQLARLETLPPFDNIFKDIHSRVLSYRPEDAGIHRKVRVGVWGASIKFPDPYEVSYLMPRFCSKMDDKVRDLDKARKGVTTLNFEKFLNLLSFAHYFYTRIHPAKDGNGRTAREITNMLCKRYGLKPPFMGPIDKKDYIKSLELIHPTASLETFEANLNPLTLFIAEILLNRSYAKPTSVESQIRQKALKDVVNRLAPEVKSMHT